MEIKGYKGIIRKYSENEGGVDRRSPIKKGQSFLNNDQAGKARSQTSQEKNSVKRAMTTKSTVRGGQESNNYEREIEDENYDDSDMEFSSEDEETNVYALL